MVRQGMSVVASRVVSVPGWSLMVACTRCGIIRQVKGTRRVELCRDCLSVDPHVWDKRQGSEGE